MTENQDTIHIEDDDARAASTPGVMRYVLGFGLFFAVVAMSAVWIAWIPEPAITRAASTPRPER